MKKNARQVGQTLVALLAFMATALTITIGATSVTIANLRSSSEYAQGEKALQVAESGADNALMRMTRNPNDLTYTNETLTVGEGTATITISGSPTYTITSVGQVGEFRRTIQVAGSRANNMVTITSWSEVP